MLAHPFRVRSMSLACGRFAACPERRAPNGFLCERADPSPRSGRSGLARGLPVRSALRSVLAQDRVGGEGQPAIAHKTRGRLPREGRLRPEPKAVTDIAGRVFCSRADRGPERACSALDRCAHLTRSYRLMDNATLLLRHWQRHSEARSGGKPWLMLNGSAVTFGELFGYCEPDAKAAIGRAHRRRE